MSLQLEPGKKLTKFQRQYLTDRGTDPDEFEARKADVDADSEPDEADVDDEDVPYSEWKLQELKVEARNRNLDDSGKQTDLVKRLEQYDADNTPDVPPHTPA